MDELKKLGNGNRVSKGKVTKDIKPVYQSEVNVLIDRLNVLSTTTIQKGATYNGDTELLRIETLEYTSDISEDTGTPVVIPIPTNYLPIRAFIQAGDGISDIVIQDGEQTVIFSLASVLEGVTVLYPKNGASIPFMPDLILTATDVNTSSLQVVLECTKSPFA